MRSVCTALVLLLAYLIFVFIAFRMLDLVIWLQQSVSSTQIVDPLLLSVRQLKQLLEIRGVSYTGYVEKQELVKLVEASADVVQGDIEELNESGEKDERERLSTTPGSSYFLGAGHFYEEVEDTKDSVWLVQVVPARSSEPLLDDYNWRVVRSHVAPFAIRTGIFDCRLDRRLCSSKGWDEPLLLLALPRGTKPKDKVIMRTCKLTRPQAIIEWLRKELSIRVKTIANLEELEGDWLGTSNSSSSEASRGVKVLLLTHLLHPPLFLAALSIKFTGRISFGIFSVKKEDSSRIGKVPTYLIITPEKTVTYGRRKMEHFNLRSMNVFLRAVQPEMNDLFLCSLTLVNMFAAFYSLQVPACSWWRLLVTTIWTVVICNLSLFAIWLILLGTLRWPLLSLTGEWSISLLRKVVLSDIGSLIRSDWIRLLRAPWVLVLSVLGLGLVWRRRRPEEAGGGGGTQPGSRRWWEMDCLFRPPPSLTRPPSQEVELEEGLEMLIERLAVPNFWLRPFVPTDYVKDLVVWRYKVRRCIKRDSPEALQRVMDASDDTLASRLSKTSSESSSDFRVTDSEPEDVIRTEDCAICLDRYRSGSVLCALPCGHNYHQKCIVVWLERDNPHCPVCRWPAYKLKPRSDPDSL